MSIPKRTDNGNSTRTSPPDPMDLFITRDEFEQLVRKVNRIDRDLRPHGDGYDEFFSQRPRGYR